MAQNTAQNTVEQIDPSSLLLDRNVRLDPQLDKTFVASIREHGVLVPLVGVRTAEGAVRVRMGHRRTLAAAELGLPTVPVVIAADEATSDEGEVERLVQQFAENEHRSGLTGAEKLGVAAQLAAFGVSPAQIAKKTRMPRAQVNAALIAAGSELARVAALRYDLTIEQAAAVAEFESDTETVKALVAAATRGQFDHALQAARDDRTDREALAAARAELVEGGITLVEADEVKRDQLLNSLADDSEPGAGLSPEKHASCPGHAAFLEQRWVWDVDDRTRQWHPTWICTDPAGHGHKPRYGAASGRQKAADMDPAERDAARAERRDVVTSNKAWGSAETVRRTWLANFLTRKTAPKGTAAFVAYALAYDAQYLDAIGGNHLASELLGGEVPTTYGRSEALPKLIAEASEARAQMIQLAMVLAAYEYAIQRDDWRTVSPPGPSGTWSTSPPWATRCPMSSGAPAVRPSPPPPTTSSSRGGWGLVTWAPPSPAWSPLPHRPGRRPANIQRQGHSSTPRHPGAPWPPHGASSST